MYKVWVVIDGEKYWVTEFINVVGFLKIHFTQDVTDSVALYILIRI